MIFLGEVNQSGIAGRSKQDHPDRDEHGRGGLNRIYASNQQKHPHVSRAKLRPELIPHVATNFETTAE